MRKAFYGALMLVCILLPECSKKVVTPETAMTAWLDRKEKVFNWEIDESIKEGGTAIYRILFTSQQWRGINWNHELTVIVPDNMEYEDALLFITGGKLKDGDPVKHGFDDELIAGIANVAVTNRTVAAILWQVPNQPLFDDLTEDALISYTLHNYLNDGDYSWPLLFPMTKSAVSAMDVIQEFVRRDPGKTVSSFVVSGASKRGWTTWLTGANDKRVKAICPMVIDVLNMPVNIDYQKKVWGDYSIEIQDYVRLGIAQQLGTPGGDDLVSMIDPYSYRDKLTMPKMIFMGTNDPYWPVDAVKNYIDSIPGENNICYTPNAGHDLGGGEKAFHTLSAFLGFIVTGTEIPDCDYEISSGEGKIALKVKGTPGLLQKAFLWTSVSEDQDFRDENWSDSQLNTESSSVLVNIEIPGSGYKAFYVDLQYKAPSGGNYTQSTRMFVADSLRLLF